MGELDGAAEEMAKMAEWLVSKALLHRRCYDEHRLRRSLTALTDRSDQAGWARTVDRTLLSGLRQAVTAAWQAGWQPADVARRVRRLFGGEHVRLAIDAMAEEMRAYAAVTVDDRWLAQLSALDASVWWEADEEILREKGDRVAMVTRAFEVLSVLTMLPRLERLCPLPGTARRAVHVPGRVASERTLARIRALLAKAESTEFPAEAETFTSAAQSLMARHSIDAAMLAAEPGGVQEPGGRRLGIEAPYEKPKAILLDVVASANRCRAIWSKDLGFSTVLGFDPDLDAVELLFTSLLVQATSAMVQAGARRDLAGRSRTRSFRQSFLAAYAQRIGERLRAASGEAVRQAVAEAGSDLLPVLAAREQAVDKAVTTLFPRLARSGVMSVNDREGWMSGRAAADLATLHVRDKIA
ncbi:DUF2786 domain-containing protein [Planotetraspora mira]|uniref:DUF2786 domain-containing protein n=1 Tax=Planotetraspora mira TaxID=58121 RepID=A0A8J3X8H0_9ACTN|nr:DUF2786 domain-containing protein [Planotetraspora mira]GII31281.1 hypothetical protein Pmi06nite_47230 [Planotetraspora mira]